ncbi:MAG: N-acetylmuramoyl-L-alanine amidase [Alphaproteobacteria bacterium]|nr:N-acetylmuramoyl-L-alanine amidase [Alphaproteobacteria bacterium]
MDPLTSVRAWFFVVLGAFALLPAKALAEPVARILSVRFVEDDSRTRIVIESDIPLKYNVFSIASGDMRIVLDLPRVRWSLNGLTAESGRGKADGLVSGYRYAQNTATTSRLVLDLARPAIVARDFVLTPAGGERHRIVMDLESTSAETFARSAALDPSGVRPGPREAPGKPMIVIDPGHGGKDPGASSADGTREKDVTLQIAMALRDELLQSKSYDVALTRSTDAFIELEERVTTARDLGADLFISLHADAGGNSEVRGASVYTLSPEGEKRAEAARQSNDWVLDVETDSSRPAEVNQILADLVQRETKNQSARFAQALVPALAEAGWPALQNTHRKKGFFVLLSPDVPAVLLEMGFITNAGDEAMLTSERKRRKLVAGVGRAIDGFFDAESRVLAQR